MPKATIIVLTSFATSVMGLTYWAALRAAAADAKDTPVATRAAASDPSAAPKLTGTPSCSMRACHGSLEPTTDPGRTILRNEYTTWLTQDRHARAYEVLFEEQALRIATNLKIEKAHESVTCLVCHTNPLAAAKNASAELQQERLLGVGCESCHGSAGKWLDKHTAANWANLSPEKKQHYGMIPVADPLALAQRCVGCHVGSGDADVNHDLIAAGHPRLNFEFTSFLANIPPHWKTAKPKRSTEARSWAVGQVVCAQAALDLLIHRSSKTASWPEFAEYDCFACHHDLRQPSWRQQQGYGDRLPGALPWSDWYTVMPRILAPLGSPFPRQLRELQKEMERPYPRPDEVAKRAAPLKKVFKGFPEGLTSKEMRGLLFAAWQNTKSATVARRSWDAGEQLYLALWALNEDAGDPALLKALQEIDGKPRGLRPGFDSPVLFEPDRFFSELTTTLKLVPDRRLKEK